MIRGKHKLVLKISKLNCEVETMVKRSKYGTLVHPRNRSSSQWVVKQMQRAGPNYLKKYSGKVVKCNLRNYLTNGGVGSIVIGVLLPIPRTAGLFEENAFKIANKHQSWYTYQIDLRTIKPLPPEEEIIWKLTNE